MAEETAGAGRARSSRPDEKDEKPEPAKPEPVDDLVTTRHTLVAAGRELRYTARAGRVVLRRESHDDDKAFSGHLPKAEVFLTAYTLDDADPRDRPVTFAFNGGPGSSSVWLHLGLLGPRRVLAGDADAPVGPPYRLDDNAESLLAHSDLVFIDPISTGYSRALAGEKPGDYHGYTGDVESVGEIIRLWTTRNGRWLSPKYLCGESYGTFRAVAVAHHLHERFGMYLNGLMLISSVLNLGEAEFNDQNDIAYSLYLPTYAAIANYHGRHGGRPLAEVLADAEAYAARDYPWVLSRGTRLSTVERADAATRLAQLTGLDADYLDRVELRVEHIRFFTELLRSRRRTVGRLDGRFLGWEVDYGLEQWRDDPSMQAILGPYTAAINHYLRAELRYASDLPYEALGDVTPWSFKEFEGRHANVADLLGRLLRGNRHLRVYVACGYYDGATPYFAAEHTFAHLRIPEELRSNIEFRYFEAGHMMYVHEPSRLAQSAQLAEFVSR